MEFVNKLYPDQDQLAGFLDPASQGPIGMVNLLRFKDKAEYDDGRETTLSGREAYDLYAQGVTELLAEVGGYLGFVGDVERLVVGEVDDLWDAVAVAYYPSRKAMMDMMQLDGMQELAQHRAAGLLGQLNLETVGMTGDWMAKS
jgi:hypothetical protein